MMITPMLTYHHVQIMAEIPQREDEIDDAYTALLNWVRAGGPDTDIYTEVSGLKKTTIRTWRERYEWDRRLEASSYGIQAKTLDARLRAQVEAYSASTSVSDLIMALVKNQLTKLALEDVSTPDIIFRPSEMASLLTAVHNYERLEAGKSTENVSSSTQIDVSRLDGMSPEELRLLRQAIPKISSGEEE